MRPSTSPSQHGFSLVEVLVAFTIFVIALGVMIELFGGGVRIADRGAEYSRAVLIAESEIALARVDDFLEPGSSTETTDDGFEVTHRVESFDLEVLPSGEAELEPYRVVVRVAWKDGRDERNVELETIILQQSESF